MNKFINKLLHEAMPYFPQQRFSELNPFLEFVIKETDCKNALEIGGANGGLTYILSRLFDKVVTIDIIHNVWYEENNIIRLTANSHNLSSQYLEKVVEFSPSYEGVKQDFLLFKPYLSSQYLEKVVEFSPYDLIFIDGDHSYEGVKQDFLLFKPLLKKSGVIALHDIKNGTVQNQNNCFVWKFIQEKEHFQDFDSYIIFNEYTYEWGGEHKPEMKDHGGIQCWFNQPEEL